MPASATSLRITDVYRARIGGIVRRTQGVARRDFPRTQDVEAGPDGSGFAGAPATWIKRTATAVEEAQREAVRSTAGYLSAYLSSELGEVTAGPTLKSAEYVGKSRGGRPVRDVLSNPLTFMLSQVGGEADPRSQGLVRALRIVELAVQQAARDSLQDGMVRDDRIDGWRRAVHGTCDACLGLAEESTLPPGTALEIHPNCECVSEPSVRPSARDAALYANPRGIDVGHYDTGVGQQLFSDLVTTSVTPREVNHALRDYMSNYQATNFALRSRMVDTLEPPSLRAGFIRTRDEILSSIELQPALKEPIRVFRGVEETADQPSLPGLQLANLKPGDLVHDLGIMSTSTDPGAITGFLRSAKSAMMEIVVPKGTKVLPSLDVFAEIVLKPGSTLRFVEVRKGTDVFDKVYVFEYVP